MFSEDRQCVALIEKNRPEWQAGLMNGIGGHVEQEEDLLASMRREFLEEAGVDHWEWEAFTSTSGRTGTCAVFRAFTDKVYDVKTMTDEKVRVVSVVSLPTLGNLMHQVNWMVHLALDDQSHVPFCTVKI